MTITTLLLALAFGVAATVAQAADLIIDADGQLTGATGVEIGGVLYDVEFVDGSCRELFDPCNDVADFEFTTRDQVILAGQALLDQVLINTADGLFDDMPQLTRGCEDDRYCSVFTPYAFREDRRSQTANPISVTVRGGINIGSAMGGGEDAAGIGGNQSKSLDTTLEAGSVFAIFTRSQ